MCQQYFHIFLFLSESGVSLKGMALVIIRTDAQNWS